MQDMEDQYDNMAMGSAGYYMFEPDGKLSGIDTAHSSGTKTGSKFPDYIDGPIVSNCHHISSEVFSRALYKIVTKHMLGLSATMKRKDGLTRVFKMFLGDIVYTKQRENSKWLQKNTKHNDRWRMNRADCLHMLSKLN